jgi:hypothetical protein
MRIKLGSRQARRARRSFRYQAVAGHRNRTLRRVLVPLLVALALGGVLLGRHGAEQKRRSVRGNAGRDIQQVILGLHEEPYRDPSGLFRIVPPSGWKRMPHSSDNPYNVVFRSPNGPDISILATPTEDEEIAELLRRVDQTEREVAIEMNIELSRFKDFRAIQRTVVLMGVKVRTVDFIARGASHHLQLAADPELFDRYLPVMMDVAETYEPLSPETTATPSR